jgi:hypothetical protein
MPGGQSAWTGGGLAPVSRQYSFIAADLPFSRSLGRSTVLADQAAKNLPARDPGSSSASPHLRTILDEYAAHYTGSGSNAALSSAASSTSMSGPHRSPRSRLVAELWNPTGPAHPESPGKRPNARITGGNYGLVQFRAQT